MKVFDVFNMVEERAKQLFDEYELYFQREKTKRFESRDCSLYGLEIKEEEGIGLRCIKGKRMGFGYASIRAEDDVDRLISTLEELTPFMDDDAFNGLPEEDRPYPSMEIYDREGHSMDDGSIIAMLIETEKAIRDYDKRIVATRNCEFQYKEIYARIKNSKGIDVEAEKTIYTIFAMAVARAKDEVSWYDWEWSDHLKHIDMNRFGISVAEKVLSFLSSRQIETGIYNGIITQRASCDMLEVLASSFLAENLFKDKTRLKDKRGKPCFSAVLNISDSGLTGMGAFPFDGEGVASRVNQVVKDGVFIDFLYDSYYARRYGRSSTGNSSRDSAKDVPKCNVRGLYIENGTEDLCKGFTDGIVIEELMGLHTANPVTGDFSLGATGHLIHNGATEPFNGIIISGNIFELLNSIKAVGTDMRWYGTYGSPSLYAEGLRVSGA